MRIEGARLFECLDAYAATNQLELIVRHTPWMTRQKQFVSLLHVHDARVGAHCDATPVAQRTALVSGGVANEGPVVIAAVRRRKTGRCPSTSSWWDGSC